MRRFEEEDQEPVAVVRTLSDFALALTLVVLMLIGTRSAAESQQAAAVRAANGGAGRIKAELTLCLLEGGQFRVPSDSGTTNGFTATAVAQPWISKHPETPATIVLQFPPKTLATDLHGAL